VENISNLSTANSLDSGLASMDFWLAKTKTPVIEYEQEHLLTLAVGPRVHDSDYTIVKHKASCNITGFI
jgi:hypothetical protein